MIQISKSKCTMLRSLFNGLPAPPGPHAPRRTRASHPRSDRPWWAPRPGRGRSPWPLRWGWASLSFLALPSDPHTSAFNSHTNPDSLSAISHQSSYALMNSRIQLLYGSCSWSTSIIIRTGEYAWTCAANCVMKWGLHHQGFEMVPIVRPFRGWLSAVSTSMLQLKEHFARCFKLYNIISTSFKIFYVLSVERCNNSAQIW